MLCVTGQAAVSSPCGVVMLNLQCTVFRTMALCTRLYMVHLLCAYFVAARLLLVHFKPIVASYALEQLGHYGRLLSQCPP